MVQELRVTQIFRREDGRWRIVHRHADSQVQKALGRRTQGLGSNIRRRSNMTDTWGRCCSSPMRRS
jgi:hypothetical protein